jgi:nucleoid-associated protein EbfC
MAEPVTLRDLMNRAQQTLLHVQFELAHAEVKGTAGGGLVTVTMLGTGEVSSVRFDQATIDEGDAEALAALTVAAFRNATDALKALTAKFMSPLTESVDGVGGLFGPHAR